MALVPFPQKSTSSAPDDDDWEDDDSESGQGKMSFLDHLDELRRRIIYSLVAILLGLGIALFFMGPLFQFIFRPMQALLPAGQTLIYTDPSEAFFLQIKIALMAGLILASPVVASQLWLFIAPGLYAQREEAGDPLRRDVVDLVRRRCRLRALSRVSDRLEILRQLHERFPDVHAQGGAGVLHVSQAGPRPRHHVPAADARAVPRAAWVSSRPG